MLEFQKGFVFNPDRSYLPSYRIGPFNTGYVGKTHTENGHSRRYFDDRFGSGKWAITDSGRSAILIALLRINLEPADEVWIRTTSGNVYVSRCVTSEIEKVCRWSMQRSAATAAVFVIHEFGYVCEDILAMDRSGLPLIEDAAHSFVSRTDRYQVGTQADYLIFSFPKYFCVQAGGLLVGKNDLGARNDEGGLHGYLLPRLDAEVDFLDSAAQRRVENFHYLRSLFSSIGAAPHLPRKPGEIPGVFMFDCPPNTDLDRMKLHGWAHGIECSVFYGRNAFFVPVHQNLAKRDLEYIFEVFRRFLCGAK